MTTRTEPPKEMVDYDFSWSRSTGMMRFRHDGGEWIVPKFVGQWQFLHTDRKTGTMHVRCLMMIQNDTAYCYVPDSNVQLVAPTDVSTVRAHDHSECQVGTSDPFPQGRNTHWRLCYAREIAMNSDSQACWRLRDERSGQLWFVDDYAGVVNVNYLEKGSHIFVDGPVWVDENGIAQFNDKDALVVQDG